MIKITDSYRVGLDGENYVKAIVDQIHFWRGVDSNEPGLDGFIELTRNGELSGNIIGVQIKSGLSHLANSRRFLDRKSRVRLRDRIIMIDREHITYFRSCKFPVIVVWFNAQRGNAFWGEVRPDSQNSVFAEHVFDSYCGKQLVRIVNRQYPDYTKIRSPGVPKINLSALKQQIRPIYRTLQTEGCYSMAHGRTYFTLDGWRHLTSQRKSVEHVARCLELIPTAIDILKSDNPRYRCHRSSKTGETLYRQTVQVTYSDRANAIVSVITKQLKSGRTQFLSVYEHRPRHKKDA